MEKMPSILQFLNFLSAPDGVKRLEKMFAYLNNKNENIGAAAKAVGMNRSQFSRFIRRNLVKRYTLHPRLVVFLERFVEDGNKIIEGIINEAVGSTNTSGPQGQRTSAQVRRAEISHFSGNGRGRGHVAEQPRTGTRMEPGTVQRENDSRPTSDETGTPEGAAQHDA